MTDESVAWMSRDHYCAYAIVPGCYFVTGYESSGDEVEVMTMTMTMMNQGREQYPLCRRYRLTAYQTSRILTNRSSIARTFAGHYYLFPRTTMSRNRWGSCRSLVNRSTMPSIECSN